MTASLKLFDLVPGWIWAIACAALLLTAGVERTRGQHARTQLAEVKAQIATERANAEKQQREIERQRAQAIQEVQDHAQAQIDALAADLAASRAAGDGLRSAAAAAARRACPHPATASSSKGEPDSLAVLIDVLGAVGERAGVYAEAADRARIAGLACEASYDALTAPAGVKLFK